MNSNLNDGILVQINVGGFLSEATPVEIGPVQGHFESAMGLAFYNNDYDVYICYWS